ncbi:MAG: porphobilinogen synthase [Phycisphaerae bacterium]
MKDFVNAIRMRRLRRTASLRDMLAESVLTPAHFVAPLFVRRGRGIRQPITSMPGQFQLSPDMALEELGNMATAGIKAYLLFGVVDAPDKDAIGSHAHDPDNAVCTTLRLARDAKINMLAITDLCYCEYTSHGHCGPLQSPLVKLPRPKKGKSTLPGGLRSELATAAARDVDNDATIAQLGLQAVLHAQAGADMVAPSGMMDHAVAAIRSALDTAGFQDTAILSYAVKYASGFYGPFREAAESPPQFGDRRGYQMDFRRNSREAIRESLLDIQEGADMVMVKPGLAYLDILSAVSQAVAVPCAVYQVSGEYAMFKAAAQAGWIDEKQCVLEMMHAFRRAGAAFIITYYTAEILRWLRE